MRKGAVLLLLLSVMLTAGAQQYTISATGGWTLPFAPPQDYTKCPTGGVDFTVAWPTVHTQGHRDTYLIGLKANFTAIPQGVAGHRIGLGGFATTPMSFINRSIAPCDLSLQLGTGLGLYTRPKEFTHDERNDFLGSFVNCVIDFGPVFTVPFRNGSALQVAAKFVHNSNGYLKKPNQGLNYVQGELGFRLAPCGTRRGGICDTLRHGGEHDARTAPFITVAPGFSVPRHWAAQNNEFYPAYTVQAGWRYAYQPCRSIGATIDACYNFADDYECHITDTPSPLPVFVGVTAQHETHWGPVSLRLGLGYYLYQSFPDGKIYERVGLFYHFDKNLHHAVGLAIKANSVHADYIEWSWTADLF